METITMPVTVSRKRGASASAKKTYTNKTPYQVSKPNSFWRLKKGLSDTAYWRQRYWRRRITGRGAYVMNPKDSFGTRWGGYFGSKAGELLGGGAQRILGLGDYSIRRNVFMTGRLPEVHNPSVGGGQVIRFQEYLSDIRTSASADTFDITSYVINAANSTTFPFLSQIAANYEQFEIQGLLFEFKSTSADALNSTNTALGSVMMATQYDVVDAPFTSKNEMLNYEFSTSGKPSQSLVHMVECDPRQTSVNELYTLPSGTTPSGSDPRLYNLGRFSIATTGFQGTNVNIGQLHVTYQVRLLKPKLWVSLGLSNKYALLTAATYSNANPLTSGALNVGFDSIGMVNNGGANLLLFPRSSAQLAYRLEIVWIGSGSVTVAAPVLTPVGLTLTSQLAINNTVAATSLCYLLGVVTDGNYNVRPSIAFGGAGTLPTSPASLIVRVMQISPVYTS